MPPQSLYLSDLLGSKVIDAAGARVGLVADVIARREELFPSVAALVVRRNSERMLRVSWSDVREIRDSQVILNLSVGQISERALQEGDVLLRAEVLDKQLVDMHGRRVVKVNDLKFIGVRDKLRVLGVDVGARGLLRRLGWEAATERMVRLARRSLPETLIPWNYVESIPARGANVRLSVPSSRLERLHPADISRIISQLPSEDRAAALEQLSDETIAEALRDLDAPMQVSLMEGLGNERASDILEQMAPDEATDLLQDLPEERQMELLTLMEREEAADIQHLLRYDEHTAGGIMTTEFLALPADLTAQEAIERVRECAPDAETIYYLYVVDGEGRLMGVLSLRSLIISPPDKRIAESMTTAIVSVPVALDQEEVAMVITKYRLLAMPVVDGDNHLMGIVTVDDTIDVVDEEVEEDLSHIAGTPAESREELVHGGSVALSRAPWLLLALTAGLLAANVQQHLIGILITRAILFLPLLFLLGNQVAARAAATTARGIALGELERGKRWAHSVAELYVSATTALVMGLVTGVAVGLWSGAAWGVAVGCSAAAVVLSGSILGLLVPLLETAVHIDPARALRPIMVSLVIMVTPAIYAFFLRVFLH